MKTVLLFLLMPFSIHASVHYPVNTISNQLIENAFAVVRLDKTEFKIIDAGKAILSKHFVVTILNDKGAEMYNDFETDYDKHTIVKEIKGYIYNQAGNEVFRLKKADITDIGMSAFSNDITDARKKVSSFGNQKFSYPYTIDFYSQVETRNMMFYPSAVFTGEEHISTEEQLLEILTPSNFEFRYKELNMPISAEITMDATYKKYSWLLHNIAADIYEELRPANTYPKVITAPIEFSVENYSGKIQNWNDVALFYSKLNSNRNQLNEASKSKILQVVEGEKDTLKMMNKLYQYLQNNTRYVSIQLGIGGWQTATAQDVFNKGYGDCKALTNYFISMLNLVGVKGYCALVKAGTDVDNFDADFPCINFNHVICCIPFKNDTFWYECTSQTSAPAFLGSFTGNRKALVINENGVMLVNTTPYTAQQNLKKRITTINVNVNSSSLATLNAKYFGIEQEEINYVYHNFNQEQQRKYLQSKINLSSFEINTFNIKSNTDSAQNFEQNLSLSINSFLSQTGLTYIFRPFIWYEKSKYLTILKKRNNTFFLNPNEFCKQQKDSIIFTFPSDLKPENIPPPSYLNSKFGEYFVYYKLEGKTLIYYRQLKYYSGNYGADEYKNWIEFNKKVDRVDRQQLSLVKVD